MVLASLLRNERRDPAELADLQSRKLKRIVAHAYRHVRFYRRVFDAARVRPDEIETAADLVRLPVIEKSELKRQAPEDLVDSSRPIGELIERRTSGSSGSPFRFFVDRAFDQHCKAQYLRPYLSNGRSVFERAVRFTSFPDTRRRWFERLGLLRETRVDCVAPAAVQLETLRRENADIVQGYPSVLAALAARIDTQERGFRAPRIVFTDSELLTPPARRLIEAAFGAPVFDVFGTFETDNIGYECEEHAGYHLAIDCVVAEFVRDGMPVEPGESGDLVCTVLDNYAMPFIRYRLDDTAAASPEACRCKRNLPLMSVVEGRHYDNVLLPDGATQSPLRILVALDSIGELALEYQIVQKATDAFQVRLVPRRALTTADREQVAGIVRRHLPGARVTVHEQTELARERSGKRRAFIREL
jgi:phenylacetate-CoA ligase